MKILQVVSMFYRSGAENLVFNLSPLLAEKGHNVHVLALYSSSNWEEENEIRGALEAQGISTHTLGCVKGDRLKLAMKLHKYLRQQGYDLIHAHAFQPNFYCRIVRPLTQTPVVVTYHSGGDDWKYTKARLVEKLVDPLSDARVSVSKVPLSHYRKHISATNPVYNIPNGIIFSNYETDGSNGERLRSELGLHPEACIFLNVGRVVKQKGQMSLIKAARLFRSRSARPFYVLIAGQLQDTELTQSIREYISANGLDDCVKLLGSRKDVTELLTLSDIFVFPSVSEAHPIALIEAAYLGKPIISTSIEAARLAFHEDSLFFVPPDSPEELANMMMNVMQHPEEAQMRANQAKREAEAKYDIRETMNRYEEIFRSVLL